MNINPLAYPTAAVAIGLFWVGRAACGSTRSRRGAALCLAVGVVAAAPGALYALYYLHWFDRAVWLYQFRSVPYTEVLAAGLGFGAGYVSGWLWRHAGVFRYFGPALIFGTCVLLAVPYLKSVLSPLGLAQVRNEWQEGICRQTTSSTCGPSCAATLLRVRGVGVTEAEIARECYTTATGTENWYLARALRRRGLRVRFVDIGPDPQALPHPAIAGLGLGNEAGHFVAVLDRTRDGYVIGDPLRGREVLPPEEVSGRCFTGFFMVVR